MKVSTPPTFTGNPGYVGRSRHFRMLLPLTTPSIVEKAMVGFALVFGPRTPGRTWGTRPVFE